MDDDAPREPFEDSRRLTGCNFHFAGTGAALETARGLAFDDAALARWRANIAAARDVLGWPQAEVVARRHRTGASLAFAAPMDQLYAATEVNEWAWWAAIAAEASEAGASAVPFSLRGEEAHLRITDSRADERPREARAGARSEVPEGQMRERTFSDGATPRKKLPFDQETHDFIRGLRSNATDVETLIWGYVRGRRLHGQKFRRQQAMGPYVLDFYCHELKLAIELDGGQHNQPEQSARDTKRDDFMAARGILTLRYWDHDVLQRTEDVLADIWRHVDRLAESGVAIGKDVPSSALRAPSPGGGREMHERGAASAFPSPSGGRWREAPDEGKDVQPHRNLMQPTSPHAPGHAAAWDADSALRTLHALAAAEANPALRALRDAADSRDLPFLPDDDEVLIGAGEGGACWLIDSLPEPAEVVWTALHAIPTALVTGSNGKTTTVRLLAAMTRAQGWRTAHSCTDGVFFDGEALESGDFSGPTGARTALRQPQAQAAVLETARGGMLRRGLALCHADAAVVTNISADHFGEYGVHDLADLAAVKLTVARAIHDDGLLALNADDALLVRQSSALGCPIGWFALDFDLPLLVAHRAQAGATCGVRAGRLLLSRGDAEHDLGAIDAMPLTLDGRATYNIANIAAAALAASALGVAPDAIAATLARFGENREDNPGRLQHWRFGDLDVYVDYAHNPDGLRGLLQAVDAGVRKGRLAMILGHAGNREDEDLREVAATVAAFRPGLVVLKDTQGYERGRGSGEVAAVMHDALAGADLGDDVVETVLEEVAAARRALAWARDGDLVVLPVLGVDARADVAALLDTMRVLHWRPGQPLPPQPDRNP